MMAALEALLVQRQVRQAAFLVAPGQSARHGPRHHLLDLGGAKAQQTGRFGLNAGGGQNGNGKALEGQGETRVRFTPGSRNGLDAMRSALDVGQACDQEGLELAAIEMSPSAFFAQIIVRSGLPTFGAQQVWLMEVVGNMDVHLLLGDVEFDVADLPWSRQAKQLAIQFSVCHGPRLDADPH